MIKDIFTKKENQIMLGVVLLSIIFISFGFYSLNKKINENPRKIPNSIEEIVWDKYENKKYNFSLEYPEHFKMFEAEEDFSPVINFYFDEGKNNLPFDNFVNQSHISVYPEGILTINSDHLEYFETVDHVNPNGVKFALREYKKTNGEIWAIQAFPESVPDSWIDFGFIWISSRLEDKETICFDGGTKIDIEFCNPLEGDQFYAEGGVDTEFIQISREILDKFIF